MWLTYASARCALSMPRTHAYASGDQTRALAFRHVNGAGRAAHRRVFLEQHVEKGRYTTRLADPWMDGSLDLALPNSRSFSARTGANFTTVIITWLASVHSPCQMDCIAAHFFFPVSSMS